MYELKESDILYVKKIISKKFKLREDDFMYDQMYSEGMFALVRCAEKYDPTKGTKFSTYAYKAILHALYNVISSRYVQEFYHNTEEDLELEGCYYELEEHAPLVEESVIKEIHTLPPADQRVFFDYVVGVSPTITAEREGIHEATVHRARQKIFKRLRKCLKQEQ